MHELSIALSILDLLQEESDARGGTTVEAVHVRLGPLSGVVAEALVSAYELAAEQTAFQNSRLVIEHVPVVVYCTNCQAERPVHSLQWFCCAQCDTPATDIIRGRELEVCALELAA